MIWGNLGIALLAGAAAVVNHVVDQKIDTVMARTRKRPVATGKIAPMDAFLFAAILASVGMAVLMLQVNHLTAWLTLASLVAMPVSIPCFSSGPRPRTSPLAVWPVPCLRCWVGPP